ncbi:hypothetical protein Tco_1115778 [Tanacetum coccineum]
MDNTNSPPNVPPLFLIEKVLNLNLILESLNLKTQSSYSRALCKKANDSDVMLIELIKNNDDLSEEELDENDDVLGEEEFEGDHFDKFPTKRELAYYMYLMSAPFPSMIVSNPIIVEGNPLNLKIPCIGSGAVGGKFMGFCGGGSARVWWVGSCGGDAGNDSGAFGKTMSRTKSGLLEVDGRGLYMVSQLVPHVRPLSKNWRGH